MDTPGYRQAVNTDRKIAAQKYLDVAAATNGKIRNDDNLESLDSKTIDEYVLKNINKIKDPEKKLNYIIKYKQSINDDTDNIELNMPAIEIVTILNRIYGEKEFDKNIFNKVGRGLDE